ncbi:RNI-like superfamily protein [Artemisia annua]|uniref:RNI-like superfamily protein n=1 Tax=Artemisia annua TaxID=35608 RepID=A0A2U1NLP1_ARTAN|nr:RNI-like superfamily protein [Artemisia annua]
MQSVSKLDRQKANKRKSAPKVKESTRTTQQKAKKRKTAPKVKESTRNWLDLPGDLTGNILKRIGVIDILDNAQKVCTTWRKICKEPSMWKVIQMDIPSGSPYTRSQLRKICKNVVDRSQGQLVDIKIEDFGDDDLLKYIADRASHLTRLEIASCYGMNGTWTEDLNKLSSLEELSLHKIGITKEAIETVGWCCPMLKILKVNQDPQKYSDETDANNLSIAIGKNLHELRHLELIGNSMTNIGLEAILDGCHHLELLDLRKCFYIDVKTDLGKRCSQQIKYLKLPNDSLDGCPYIYENDSDSDPYADLYCDCGLTPTDSDDARANWTAYYMDYYSLL